MPRSPYLFFFFVALFCFSFVLIFLTCACRLKLLHTRVASLLRFLSFVAFIFFLFSFLRLLIRSILYTILLTVDWTDRLSVNVRGAIWLSRLTREKKKKSGCPGFRVRVSDHESAKPCGTRCRLLSWRKFTFCSSTFFFISLFFQCWSLSTMISEIVTSITGSS